MSEEKTVDTDDKGGSNENTQTKPDTTPNSGEQMIPKARFDQVNQQKKEAIDTLQSVADELAKDVPEEFQSLIPNLTPAGKIGWIRNAISKGLFDKQKNDGLDTKRPAGGKPPLDTSKMSPMEMMSHGYK